MVAIQFFILKYMNLKIKTRNHGIGVLLWATDFT